MAKILLIDDCDPFRRVAHVGLTRAGHEVHAAGSGAEALNCFPQVKPDLVITDLLMPDMDGLTTISELRRVDPKVPVIAVSGGGRICADQYLRIAKNLGAVRLLTKPFALEALTGAIDELTTAGR
ncbi:MAG: response regulator [Verrucomicrobia bacterium]|nr:response regulator [Verrucomicrobiota bacterium]